MIKIILVLMTIGYCCSAQIKPLAIGDQVPDLQFKHLLDGQSPMRLSDFKGKAIVLDLWATWCGTCLSTMPYMDSLQRHFGKDLQVICITYENDKLVWEVLKKVFPKGAPAMAMVVRDSLAVKYFPHRSFPHYIWISKNGKVMAITDKAELSDAKIESLISGTTLKVHNKPKVIVYNTQKPPYASKQILLGDEFLFHSQVTGYRDDLPTFYSRGIRNDYISCLNSPITRLYQMAFGEFAIDWFDMNRAVLVDFKSFADSAKIGVFITDSLTHAWKADIQKNAYSYELAIKDSSFSKAQLFRIMQEDLNRYFGTMGIEAHLEKRQAKLIALVQLGDNTRYRSVGEAKSGHYSGKNFIKIDHEPMGFFLTQLMPNLRTPGSSLVNDTGYTGYVSLELEQMDGLENINKGLLPYGLVLKQKMGTVDMVVITKTK